MIDLAYGRHPAPPGARAFLFLPSIGLTWLPGCSSYGLTLAWLSWSATVAWGKGTRP